MPKKRERPTQIEVRKINEQNGITSEMMERLKADVLKWTTKKSLGKNFRNGKKGYSAGYVSRIINEWSPINPEFFAYAIKRIETIKKSINNYKQTA